MKPKSTIILFAMFTIMMTWFGIVGCRWANRQSQICEQQYQQAIDMLMESQ